jgi:hypothetical protein
MFWPDASFGSSKEEFLESSMPETGNHLSSVTLQVTASSRPAEWRAADLP